MKWFDAIQPYKDLYEDIYESLVEENMSYLEKFNIQKQEARNLAEFLTKKYGHHEDFKNYLIVNKSQFKLGHYMCNHMKLQIQLWDKEMSTEMESGPLFSSDQLRISSQKLLAINSKYLPLDNKMFIYFSSLQAIPGICPECHTGMRNKMS